MAKSEIQSRLDRPRKISFVAGAALLILCGVGLAVARRAFFVSWLCAFIFWIGLSLGCLNAAMMHCLAGGRWGNVTRRFLEAGFMTLPLMAIFFVPILFGLHQIYPWARPDEVAGNKFLQQKVHYENFAGFLFRTVFFFGIWIVIASRLRKWSLQQDATVEIAPTIKMRTLSGPGIVIVPLTITFALVDWIMSLEPAWFSTIFGVVLLAGQIVVALSFIILLLGWLRPSPPFRDAANEKQFHDLGNLLLAFVMFWTYVAFSQFLIIYSGNQPHEIGWYLRRIAGNWKWLIGFVVAFHFFVPFSLLLFRAITKNIRALAAIAAMLFVIHAIEIFWLIAPTFYRDGVKIHWTDFAAWFGIGGIWVAVFVGNLKRHPLLARNDPRIENAAAQTHAANAK